MTSCSMLGDYLLFGGEYYSDSETETINSSETLVTAYYPKDECTM
jgi:hypothetical protein